ncbi:uncharacterized protein TNCV_4506571 [Trichonephila clavipes]|nr:uncharacterized protein TNCV_4506571 [Trichonephila clavipes]
MVDIRVTRFTLPNDKPIVVLTVYISVTDIIDYIHEALLAHTLGGSKKLLGKQYHVLPLILGGDFNIDFDKVEGLRLVQFLKSELNLDFVSGKALGMIR